MLIRSYQEVHSPHTNATLLHTCNEIGKRNYWIGKDTPPHNMVEEYLQQWHRQFLTGDYVGIEYWVHQSEENNPFGFHFDKDEHDPQIEHPKWIGCINLTMDQHATCISDMKYGDIKPKECIYSYGNEGKVTIWSGEYAYGDMVGMDDTKIYVNVWTKREPKGLIRSKEIEYPRQKYFGMMTKDKVEDYTGATKAHTHICQDLFDLFILKEPIDIGWGGTYRVPDCVV